MPHGIARIHSEITTCMLYTLRLQCGCRLPPAFSSYHVRLLLLSRGSPLTRASSGRRPPTQTASSAGPTARCAAWVGGGRGFSEQPHASGFLQAATWLLKWARLRQVTSRQTHCPGKRCCRRSCVVPHTPPPSASCAARQAPSPQSAAPAVPQLTRTSPGRGAHPGAWPPACPPGAPRCKSQSRSCTGGGGGVEARRRVGGRGREALLSDES